jgi:hypothetical protein
VITPCPWKPRRGHVCNAYCTDDGEHCSLFHAQGERPLVECWWVVDGNPAWTTRKEPATEVSCPDPDDWEQHWLVWWRWKDPHDSPRLLSTVPEDVVPTIAGGPGWQTAWVDT